MKLWPVIVAVAALAAAAAATAKTPEDVTEFSFVVPTQTTTTNAASSASDPAGLTTSGPEDVVEVQTTSVPIAAAGFEDVTPTVVRLTEVAGRDDLDHGDSPVEVARRDHLEDRETSTDMTGGGQDVPLSSGVTAGARSPAEVEGGQAAEAATSTTSAVGVAEFAAAAAAAAGVNEEPVVTDPTESVESLMDNEEDEVTTTTPVTNARPPQPEPSLISTTTSPPALAPQQQQEEEVKEMTTNMYPLDNEVRIDSEEIVDVIRNFIAEKDPMLELFLTVCFVHPHCFKFEAPIPGSELGAEAREILQLLQSRRPESARRRLLEKIEAVRVLIKHKMFQILSEEVGARGVSVAATKNIIDSVKDVWLGVTADLSSVVASIQEIFTLGIPDVAAVQDGMAGTADIIQRIPAHVEHLFRTAAQNGFSRYRKMNSWDSWKL